MRVEIESYKIENTIKHELGILVNNKFVTAVIGPKKISSQEERPELTEETIKSLETTGELYVTEVEGVTMAKDQLRALVKELGYKLKFISLVKDMDIIAAKAIIERL